jgi:hypothetical protein
VTSPQAPTIQDVHWEYFRRWVSEQRTLNDAAKLLGTQGVKVGYLLRRQHGWSVRPDHLQAIASAKGLLPSDVLLELAKVAFELQTAPKLLQQRLEEVQAPRRRGRKAARAAHPVAPGFFLKDAAFAKELQEHAESPAEENRSRAKRKRSRDDHTLLNRSRASSTEP